MKTAGLSLDALNRQADLFAAQMTGQIRGLLGDVRRSLDTHVTVDDLGIIPARWAARVDGSLMRHVAAAYWAGVDQVALPVGRHLAQTADATSQHPAHTPVEDVLGDPDLIDPGAPGVIGNLKRVSNPTAESFLANARNRLVGVGNIVWEQARGSLLDGMQQGLGVSGIAQLITQVASLASPRAEVIARTEVNGASNAGALDQIRAFGVPATKTWLATQDERTRPDHADADGQEVGLDETFDVGGEQMDRPGDPNASAGQTVNCRCTVTFSISDDSVDGAVLDEGSDAEVAAALVEPDCGCAVTAAAMSFDGAMIALVPAAEHAKRLALDGYEPPEIMHLTLAFLGPAAAYSDSERQSLKATVGSFFAGTGSIIGRAYGVNHWNPDGPTPAWVFAVGDDINDVNQDSDTPDDAGQDDSGGSLTDARDVALAAIRSAQLQDRVPPQHTPWVPHVAAAYTPGSDVFGDMVKRCGPVTFDAARLAFGDDTTDFPLDDSGDDTTGTTDDGGDS